MPYLKYRVRLIAHLLFFSMNGRLLYTDDFPQLGGWVDNLSNPLTYVINLPIKHDIDVWFYRVQSYSNLGH